MGDIPRALSDANRKETGHAFTVTELSAGDGRGEVTLTLPAELFYSVLGDMTGLSVEDDASLLSLMRDLADCKRNWEKVASALADVGENGYGIVMPAKDEMRLEEPRLTKQPGGWGVKLRASARSIHMIRANIETEINPVIGTEEQAKEMVAYLKGEFEEDPERVWDFNMFGKSLYEMLGEGIRLKMQNMPEESRTKMSETLERIVNEGSGGLICILL